MWSSYSLTICLTLFRGTGLGFTFSHFPVLGGGVGLMRCKTSGKGGGLFNLVGLVSTMTTLGFFFSCFNSNSISWLLVSFLRSFFSISILYYNNISLSHFCGAFKLTTFK